MRANRRAGGVVQGSSPCTRLHCAFGAALCLRALPAPRRFAARSVSRRSLAMPPAVGREKRWRAGKTGPPKQGCGIKI